MEGDGSAINLSMSVSQARGSVVAHLVVREKTEMNESRSDQIFLKPCLRNVLGVVSFDVLDCVYVRISMGLTYIRLDTIISQGVQRIEKDLVCTLTRSVFHTYCNGVLRLHHPYSWGGMVFVIELSPLLISFSLATSYLFQCPQWGGQRFYICTTLPNN